jgi:hypothetical protein
MRFSIFVMSLFMLNCVSTSLADDARSTSSFVDLFFTTLKRTFDTPIVMPNSGQVKFSVEIMLANDVFNLDDALRLFIQQFIIALFNGRIDYLPADWETTHSAYVQVINEINNLLDLIAQRTLSQISMEHVRPLVKSTFVSISCDNKRTMLVE